MKFADFDIVELYVGGLLDTDQNVVANDAIKTALYEQYGELELVEEFASDNNLIDSEQALSDLFDESFEDFLHENRDDRIMISETFNNWSDGLCKDGQLHSVQYHNYCYVGKYSN